MEYPILFSPFDLAGVTVPNRIVMAPMSTGLAGGDGAVTPRQLAFYRARVAGGVGMVIVEFTCVHRADGVSELHQLSLEDETHLEGHRQLVEMIKGGGAVACLQLQHGGPFARRDLIEGGIARGPVDIASRRHPSGLGVKALSDGELEFLVECFGRTASLAVDAGYDAIELHGAHGYLLTSFLSPYTNKRVDAWGGDEDRRLRLPAAVVSRVKAAIGARPLIYRLSGDEFVPGGLTVEDMERIAPKLVEAGADAIHVSLGIGNGSYDKVLDPMSAPEGWRLPYSRRLRESCRVPVITVGQIRWPQTAERALRDGDADLIALGRPLLADPAWAIKARRSETTQIVPCTSCNYCVTLAELDRGVGCAENPLTGRELDPPLPESQPPGLRAVVIGGGPGGMAASLMLDAAGYQTELYEARDRLGGGLIASAAPPHKDKLLWYLDYLRGQLARSRVSIRCGQRVAIEALIEQKPAVLLLADGAAARRLPIDGIDEPIVFDAYEALMGDDSWRPGTRGSDSQQYQICHDSGEPPLVVYGGGETGCELSEFLAERGFEILLITRSDRTAMARSADRVYRTVLLRRLAADNRVEILDNSRVVGIEAGGVRVADVLGQVRFLPASRVFIAQGRQPPVRGERPYEDRGVRVRTIGDSRECGRIGDAVRDAYLAVRSLGPE